MSLSLDWITLNGSGDTSISKLGIGTTTPSHPLDVVGNANVSGTVSASALDGTLSTAAQPNITSVGTLTSLEVLGRITAENSVIYSKAYYVNDGGKTLQAGIDEMGLEQAAILNVSSGSYGDSDVLVHDKINIGIEAPIPGNMYITEIGSSSSARTLTISGTNSTRVRMTGFQVKGKTTISGTQGRHYFHRMNFAGGLEFTGTTGNWIVFNQCDFDGGVSIPNTFGGIIYFVECAFAGSAISCSSASAQQVILMNCSGLQSLTLSTVTYLGQCLKQDGTSILVNPGSLISGSLTGTLSTAAQPNITSVGTLTSLNVGNVTSSGTVSASTLSTTGPVIANSLSVNGLDPAIDSSLNFDPSIGSLQLTHAVGGLAPTVEITSDNGNILLNPEISGSSFPSSITVSGDIDYTGTLRQNGIAVNFGNSSGIPPVSFLVRGYSAGGTGDLAYSTTVSGDQTWFGRLPAECYHQIGMTIGSDLSFVAPQSGYYFLSLAFSSMSSGTSGSRHLNSLEFTIDGNVTSIEIIDLGYSISGSTQLDQTGSWSTVMYLASGTKVRPFIHTASDNDYRYCNFGGFITNGGSSQWSASGTDVFYTSGNVGIGTSSPSQKLTIGSPSAPIIRFDRYEPTRYDFEIGMESSADLIFRGGADGTGTGLTEFMRINDTGNVGIGSNNPADKLHIWGTDGVGLRISSGGSVFGSGKLSFYARDENGASDVHFGSVTSVPNVSDANCRMDFRVGSQNLLVASMTGSGNIGMGKTDPFAKFDLYTLSGKGMRVVNSANSSSLNNIVFQASAADGQVGYEGLVVNGQSRVGIGTFVPRYPLDIAGSVIEDISVTSPNDMFALLFYDGENYMFSSSSVSSRAISMRASGYVWANTGLITGSDERIKKNIVNLNDGEALDKLRLIEPAKYKYVDVTRGTSEVFGFIAQQVRENFPEAVTLQSSVIPNVYRLCTVDLLHQTITIPSKATAGRLRIVTISGIQKDVDVTNPRTDVVQLPSDTLKQEDLRDGNVFVYGYEVSDFHALNKDYLFTINFAATQELDRKNQELEAKNQELTLKVISLESQLQSLRNALIDRGVIE